MPDSINYSWNLACNKMYIYIVPVWRSDNLVRNPVRCSIDVLPINSWTHGTMGPVCFLTENEIVVQMDNQTRCFGDCFQQRPGLSESILMIEAWNRDHFTHRRGYYMNQVNVHHWNETTPSNRLASSLPHPPSGLRNWSGRAFGRFYDFLASHSSEPMGPQHSGLVQ